MTRNDTRRNVTGTKLEAVEDVVHLQKMAEALWSMLDDIDTASDMFKPTTLDGYTAFYKYVMSKVAKRFDQLESDGYNLFLSKNFSMVHPTTPEPKE